MEIILKEPKLMLDADTNLIEQILINLIVNAIKAVKDGKQRRIILSAAQAPPSNKLAIKVIDNGSGMNEEVINNIFILFFSAKKIGSGIGLSLCKQIMMLHKEINVQSVESIGTVFTLQF